jgi:hypothetical protein
LGIDRIAQGRKKKEAKIWIYMMKQTTKKALWPIGLVETLGLE